MSKELKIFRIWPVAIAALWTLSRDFDFGVRSAMISTFARIAIHGAWTRMIISISFYRFPAVILPQAIGEVNYYCDRPH